ncbi:MAG: tetratricopeptide repeat protein [Bacteroidota bacterium]|nr:tetratricopeptide repeat protein [Bacteroidota bacterium]
MKDQDIELEDNNEMENEQEQNSGPSSFNLFVDKIKAWINGQNKTLVFGVSAVVLITAGIVLYQYLYQMPREKKGMVAIIDMQKQFDDDSFSLILKKGPKIADEYSGTKAGDLAAYYVGVSYLYTGDFKNAVTYLEKVSFDDKVMKPQAIGLLGDAHVENKDLESGLKQYLKAAKVSKNSFSTIWWSKKAARVYEKKDEWKKALAIYEDLQKNFKDEDGISELSKYIARAKAKLDIY